MWQGIQKRISNNGSLADCLRLARPLLSWLFRHCGLGLYIDFLCRPLFVVFFKKKSRNQEVFGKSFPEICLILPVYNEQAYILSTLDCLLNLPYPNKKILIVNDGSNDNTWKLIQEKLDIELVEPVFKNFISILPSKKVKGIYKSRLHRECLVIHKENGSRYDALNAGLNYCRSPYFLTVDADTCMSGRSLFELAEAISSNPHAIAIGAVVRIRDIEKIAGQEFAIKFLSMIQSVEYLRTFLMRLGWEEAGGIAAFSGAFSCFRTETVIQAGGFAPTFAHDLEIVIRLHRWMQEKHLPYQMIYLSDPLAWTYALTSLKALKVQRMLWHKGLLESMGFHKKLFFNRAYGVFGLFIYPLFFFGEVLAPAIELLGYLYFAVGWVLGVTSMGSFVIFLFLTIGFSIAMSWISLLTEELIYKKSFSIRRLTCFFGYSLMENLGFRQLTLLWKGLALFSFFI